VTSQVDDDASGGAGRVPAIGLFLGPALAILVMVLPLQPDLSREGQMVLALLALMATWWVTEALPLAATALVPIIAVPLIGIDVTADARGALSCATAGPCLDAFEAAPSAIRTLTLADLGPSYANSIVLLYIGGFLLGIAIERWGLSTRIAYSVVSKGGLNPKLMLAGFFVAAGFISMWISNTSTSMILTPLALAVAAGGSADGKAEPKFATALVLGIAWAATIGGLATPIGTPPNGIALAQLRSQGIEVSFGQWLSVGLPVVLVLLPVGWFILSRGLKLNREAALAAQARVREALSALGAVTTQEKRVVVVFLLVAGLWVSSSFLAPFLSETVVGGRLSPGHLDTMIATLGALLLFMVPAGGSWRQGLLTWDDAAKIPWGILLLFGGGLALATAADMSGLSPWMAERLRGLTDLHPLLLLLAVGVMVVFITEFASNIATISLMGPVLISLAQSEPTLGAAAFIVPAAMLASMGFAMPIGSASNAIAYGTGVVKQGVMIRKGLMMNLAALIVLTIVGLTLAPMIFGR